MTLQNQRVQKLITFSPQLYTIINQKAQEFGLSFGEYLRMLAANDVKKEVENSSLLEEKIEKKIGQALKDFQDKNYTIIRTRSDLKKHLKNL